MQFTESIVALSSGHLPSGVAVIRISGPHVRFAIETMLGVLPKPRMARYGALYTPDGVLLDHGLTLHFPGPASFTGEDCGEFHVHGGRAVVAAMLDAITKLDGFRHAEPGEFTKRAFLNGKLDLLKAEALADLINAETEAQRRFAVVNAQGVQGELYAGWRSRLVHARAMIEAEMDFADEADIPGSVSSTVWSDVRSLIGEIERHVAGFGKAEMIRDGFDVVILGAPNAGKSSLLNALLKREAAIVTDEPGTTRDLVEAVLDLDGLKVRITDTAGLREPAGQVEAIGIARARERAKTADLIVFLEDMSAPPSDDKPMADKERAIIVGTKLDQLQNSSGGLHRGYDLEISTRSGVGLDQLLELIAARAKSALGDRSEILPSRMRHVELLREATTFLKVSLTDDQEALELKAENLRLASARIGRISGAVDVEDLLDVIFSQFCVGK